MLYKNVLLGTENDHELSIWVESEVAFSKKLVDTLIDLVIDDDPKGNFELYFDNHGHYRSDKFTFDDEGLAWLYHVIVIIDKYIPDDCKIGVAIYSNEFTHIEGNIEEIAYSEFLVEVA